MYASIFVPSYILEEGMLIGQDDKKYSFLSWLIDNLKLFTISKNQSHRSIRREDMRVFPLFDLGKALFIHCCPPWYVDLVKALDMFLGVSTFQFCFTSSQYREIFFVDFSYIFEFVPCLISLQIEPESWNLVCRFSSSHRCAFGGVDSLPPKPSRSHHLTIT